MLRGPLTRLVYTSTQPALLQRTVRPTYTPLARAFSTSPIAKMVQEIKSYDEFKKIIAEDKVAAIDFWATWCGPCKMISPLFEKFANEAPADQIAFYKVDVDEQEQISQECGIKAMPTFIFFKKGEKISSVVGPSPQQLQAAIKQQYS